MNYALSWEAALAELRPGTPHELTERVFGAYQVPNICLATFSDIYRAAARPAATKPSSFTKTGA